VWITRRPVKDAARRRKLMISVAVLVVATVATLTWIGSQVIGFFGNEAPTKRPPLVSTTTAEQPKSTSQPNGSAAAAGTVRPGRITAFAATGDLDGASRAVKVIDGDAATVWRTDRYYQQFPKLKPGTGLIATFDDAVSLAGINIDSPSEGTQIEIRTASSARPKLGETQVIGRSTLHSGRTTVRLDPVPPGKYVIIWITQLSGGDRNYQSQLGEIGFVRTT
jgi:hypothetical protein